MSLTGKRLVVLIQAMFLGLAASLLVGFVGTFYNIYGAMVVISIVAGFAYGFGVLAARFQLQLPVSVIIFITAIIPAMFVVRDLRNDNSNSLAFAVLTVAIGTFVFMGSRTQGIRK